MDNADADRTGDIALDFDASARFHSARILRLFFRNAPSITALVVVTGCNKTSCCRDSSFKPICLKVKRTPRRGLARLAWGVISGIPRSTKECGNRPMARSASPEGAIEIASAWLLARRPNSMQGMRRGSGQSSADTNNAGTPEPPERFSR